MTQITLNATEWTKIVEGTGDDDVVISAAGGKFHASIHQPTEEGPAARIVATAALADVQTMWTSVDVNAGIAVYAKSIGGGAVAVITPAKR